MSWGHSEPTPMPWGHPEPIPTVPEQNSKLESQSPSRVGSAGSRQGWAVRQSSPSKGSWEHHFFRL